MCQIWPQYQRVRVHEVALLGGVANCVNIVMTQRSLQDASYLHEWPFL